MTITTDNAENQAKAQLENIQAMMARLEHTQECDGAECILTIQDFIDGLEYMNSGGVGISELREQYHNEDEALERIQEDPLSVQVRSDWTDPYRWNGPGLKAAEYEILLMTGGPAVRIIGDLPQHDEPDNAHLQYQDWGTPWTELFPTDMVTLIAYARTFYFGD